MAEESSRARISIDLVNRRIQGEAWESLNGYEVGVDTSSISPRARICLVKRHDIGAAYDHGISEWSVLGEDGYTEDFIGKTVFQAAISGAGRLFTLFDSMLMRGDLRLLALEVGEQAVARLGIADERFEEWFVSQERKQRDWCTASRTTPVVLRRHRSEIQLELPADERWVLSSSQDDGDQWTLDAPDVGGAGSGPGRDLLWPRTEYGLDALIVHQGLLDKAFSDDKTRARLTRMCLGLKDVVPVVVITSGRGRPENLPLGTRYLPYSAIESATHGGYFEKLVLWRTLTSL